MRLTTIACGLGLLAILLSGCQTPEERAERQMMKTMRSMEQLAKDLDKTLDDIEEANK
jgi:hypothetical protein